MQRGRERIEERPGHTEVRERRPSAEAVRNGPSQRGSSHTQQCMCRSPHCHELVGGICCWSPSSPQKFWRSHGNELSSQIKHEMGAGPLWDILFGSATSALLSVRTHTNTHTHRKGKTKEPDSKQRDNNSIQREMELAFSSPI